MKITYCLTGGNKLDRLKDMVDFLVKKAVTPFDHNIFVFSNEKDPFPILEQYKKDYPNNIFSVFTDSNSGWHCGASDGTQTIINLINHNEKIKTDFLVFSHWDCFIYNIEKIIDICKEMKEKKKIMGGHLREINLKLKELISPHSDFIILDALWVKDNNLGCFFVKKEKDGDNTLELFFKEIYEIIYKEPIYPKLSYFLSLGFRDYYIDTGVCFHFHNEDDYQKAKEKIIKNIKEEKKDDFSNIMEKLRNFKPTIIEENQEIFLQITKNKNNEIIFNSSIGIEQRDIIIKILEMVKSQLEKTNDKK